MRGTARPAPARPAPHHVLAAGEVDVLGREARRRAGVHLQRAREGLSHRSLERQWRRRHARTCQHVYMSALAISRSRAAVASPGVPADVKAPSASMPGTKLRG